MTSPDTIVALSSGALPSGVAIVRLSGPHTNAVLTRLTGPLPGPRRLALRPLRLTYLPEGSFDRYTEAKRIAGADLGHLKPLHMNATDAAISERTAEAPPEPVRLR